MLLLGVYTVFYFEGGLSATAYGPVYIPNSKFLI